jgi:hypothetical protein
VPDFLAQMWELGATWLRVTPVVVTGAAARGGDWRISKDDLRKVATEFEQSHGTSMKIEVLSGTGGGLQLQGREAPGSYLVRPNGDIRPDSLRPFTFGNAIADGIATCWQRIRDGWADDRINRWAGSLKSSADMPKSDLIAYLDDEVDLSPDGDGERGSGRDAPVPAPTPPKDVDPVEDLAVARAKVHDLSLSRRYRQAPLRSSGSSGRRIVRLVGDGSYLRLNESGAVVMDSLDGGTMGDAAEQLSKRFGITSERAERDALAATRELQRRRVVLAEDAVQTINIESGTSDLPGLEPTG